ncbi:tail fiber protein [Chitinophaga agrisoli]|uniref:Tail fiber protein n=1 Tax=Chitinophaga agrisoli TaxID=2607653 RepID=A0A5B2VJ38_9BACT|nr:tail fiber protein [Chitinophaga agrisoli]KAA2239603.1 tail fiber protein [Chitinophaga agrisoli]
MGHSLKTLIIALLCSTVIIPLHAQTSTNALNILPNGNVGIGVDQPSEKLEVQGTLKVNGRIMDKTGPVMPAGAILQYAGSVAPAGWLLCDGTSYAKTGDQKDLFAVIGVMYGSDGNDKFRVPDLRGTFIMGADPRDASESVAKQGNPDVHNHTAKPPVITPTTMEAGSHNHKMPSAWYDRSLPSSGFDKINGIDRGSPSVSDQTTQNAGAHTHQVTVDIPQFTTGNSSGKNRPKWIALNYIIKY